MWISWFIAARAGIPVIHDGGVAAEVIAAASARTGLPQTELTAQALDTLLAAPPQVLGDAVIRRCAKTATQMPEVFAELARAEVAFAKQDPFGAMDHLDLAVATLGCLDQIVEPDAAARVFRLRGAVELSESDVEGARGELRTALAFEPTLVWDAGLPAAGAALLDEERAAVASCALGTMPPASTSGPWIDSRSATASPHQVAPGLHLAQYGTTAGIRSAWLVVGGDATLVVPTSFRRPVVERMADPAGRPQVEALLAAAIPDFYAGYVAFGGGLWLVTRDQDQLATTELVAVPPAEPVPTSGKKGKKPKR